MSETYAGVTFQSTPIVCEHHPVYDYENAQPGQILTPTYRKVTVGGSMVSSRGLICPICYRVARYATPEEVKELHLGDPV